MGFHNTLNFTVREFVANFLLTLVVFKFDPLVLLYTPCHTNALATSLTKCGIAECMLHVETGE